MPFITIEVTDLEFYALELVAVDPNQWSDHVVTNRAWVAKEELKSTPEWVKAAVAHGNAGGDPEDDWAILAKGKELGIFKTAAQQHEEFLKQFAAVPAVEEVDNDTN